MKLALVLTEEDPVVTEVEAEDPTMVAGAVIKIVKKPLLRLFKMKGTPLHPPLT